MVRITMISGATRLGGSLRRPADGPFWAEEAVAERLVRAGVARYCGEIPSEAVATFQEGDVLPTPGDDTPQGNGAQGGAGALSMDPEQLKRCTNAELLKLAGDMGLDASRCRTKAQLMELITGEPVSAEPGSVLAPDGEDGDSGDEDEDLVEDGEAPPDLSPEAPVV